MTRLAEAVVNFSEGRDRERIDRILDPARATEGVELLDLHTDPDHNRSVVTFWGRPAELSTGCFRLASASVQEIDLREHSGVHPRMGAVDVIPLVPVQDLSREELLPVARELGERVGEELDLPVFFYADSATRPEREKLVNIRRGEFEGLAEKMEDPKWQPDCGPAEPHSTAGAVAVGVRGYLVAYNLVLDTDDLQPAREIVSEIRTAKGGPPGILAMAVELESRGKVQVSMNLTEPETTRPDEVRELVEEMAAGLGVSVLEAELVGMLPMDVVEQQLTETVAENFHSSALLDPARW